MGVKGEGNEGKEGGGRERKERLRNGKRKRKEKGKERKERKKKAEKKMKRGRKRKGKGRGTRGQENKPPEIINGSERPKTHKSILKFIRRSLFVGNFFVEPKSPLRVKLIGFLFNSLLFFFFVFVLNFFFLLFFNLLFNLLFLLFLNLLLLRGLLFHLFIGHTICFCFYACCCCCCCCCCGFPNTPKTRSLEKRNSKKEGPFHKANYKNPKS